MPKDQEKKPLLGGRDFGGPDVTEIAPGDNVPHPQEPKPPQSHHQEHNHSPSTTIPRAASPADSRKQRKEPSPASPSSNASPSAAAVSPPNGAESAPSQQDMEEADTQPAAQTPKLTAVARVIPRPPLKELPLQYFAEVNREEHTPPPTRKLIPKKREASPLGDDARLRREIETTIKEIEFIQSKARADITEFRQNLALYGIYTQEELESIENLALYDIYTQGDLESIEELIREIENKIERLTAKKTSLENSRTEEQKELAEIERLTAKKTDLKKECTKKKEELQKRQKERDSIDQKLEQRKLHIRQSLIKQQLKLQTHIKYAQREIRSIETYLAQFAKPEEHEKLNQEIQSLNTYIARRTKKIGHITAKLESLNTNSEADKQKLSDRITALQEEIKALQQKIQQQKKVLWKNIRKRDKEPSGTMKTRRDNIDADIRSIQHRINTDISNLQTQIAWAKQKSSNLTTEIATPNDTIAAQENEKDKKINLQTLRALELEKERQENYIESQQEKLKDLIAIKAISDIKIQIVRTKHGISNLTTEIATLNDTIAAQENEEDKKINLQTLRALESEKKRQENYIKSKQKELKDLLEGGNNIVRKEALKLTKLFEEKDSLTRTQEKTSYKNIKKLYAKIYKAKQELRSSVRQVLFMGEEGLVRHIYKLKSQLQNLPVADLVDDLINQLAYVQNNIFIMLGSLETPIPPDDINETLAYLREQKKYFIDLILDLEKHSIYSNFDELKWHITSKFDLLADTIAQQLLNPSTNIYPFSKSRLKVNARFKNAFARDQKPKNISQALNMLISFTVRDFMPSQDIISRLKVSLTEQGLPNKAIFDEINNALIARLKKPLEQEELSDEEIIEKIKAENSAEGTITIMAPKSGEISRELHYNEIVAGLERSLTEGGIAAEALKQQCKNTSKIKANIVKSPERLAVSLEFLKLDYSIQVRRLISANMELLYRFLTERGMWIYQNDSRLSKQGTLYEYMEKYGNAFSSLVESSIIEFTELQKSNNPIANDIIRNYGEKLLNGISFIEFKYCSVRTIANIIKLARTLDAISNHLHNKRLIKQLQDINPFLHAILEIALEDDVLTDNFVERVVYTYYSLHKEATVTPEKIQETYLRTKTITSSAKDEFASMLSRINKPLSNKDKMILRLESLIVERMSSLVKLITAENISEHNKVIAGLVQKIAINFATLQETINPLKSEQINTYRDYILNAIKKVRLDPSDVVTISALVQLTFILELDPHKRLVNPLKQHNSLLYYILTAALNYNTIQSNEFVKGVIHTYEDLGEAENLTCEDIENHYLKVQTGKLPLGAEGTTCLTSITKETPLIKTEVNLGEGTPLTFTPKALADMEQTLAEATPATGPSR
jgi:predicted  nucleic acid-binding Zn-ribbon protein